MGTKHTPRDLPQRAASAQDATDRITSDVVLRGHREVQIDHAGEIYRLRVTRSGKLILTK